MNKYRELFEKYVAEVGRAPHALTRVWVLGFCDWLALNESGLTKRALDGATGLRKKVRGHPNRK
ncbi:MAG: hypothetical protein ACOY4M_08220 [Pseudomonadota bacterium]